MEYTVKDFVEMVAAGNTEIDQLEDIAKQLLSEVFSLGFAPPANNKAELRRSHQLALYVPPDPEENNPAYAKAAGAALKHFIKIIGEKPWPGITKEQRHDLEAQNIVDFLGDLAHYCDRQGIELQECLRVARNHYTEETDRKGLQFPAPVATLPKPLSDSSNLTTIFVALRMFQREFEDCDSVSIAEAWPDYFTIENEGTEEATVTPQPLGTDDIDTLCEELNCGPVEDAYQTSPQAEAYRKAADENHSEEGTLEIDDNAPVSKGRDKGAYVQAWVWITEEEAGICRNCGAVDASGGDGFDGLCPECADKTQCSVDGCDEVVETDSQFFATPCGSFCDEHMRAHVKDCEVCRKAFPELAS